MCLCLPFVRLAPPLPWRDTARLSINWAPRPIDMRPLLALLVLCLGAAAALASRPAARSVARPALRLGGEWAGVGIAFSPSGGVEQTGVDQLTSERWTSDGLASSAVIRRQSVQLLPDGDTRVTEDMLPSACSGSTILRLGNSMLEPDVLNANAWALDAAQDGGLWRCETIFDGLGGDRPTERADALECPKERTRVQCSFDPVSGTLDPPVLVWQERCWSASPAKDLDVQASDGLDAAWVSSAVGLNCFGDDAATGGIELRPQPGLLEIVISSGRRSQNRYQQVVVRRSWIGGSVFAEVESIGDTNCNQ